MSQENINDIFNDELEEGEIEPENDEEESKEDDEEWGGSEVLIPTNEIISAILGLPTVYIAPTTLPPDPPPQLPQINNRIRRRNEVITTPPPLPNKIYRNQAGKRVIRERSQMYSYLLLKSGDEFHFTEEDGKNIILNEIVEPNRLIRNIISRVPFKLIERLEYLGKFSYDEESESESDEENSKKVQKRYFGNLKELVYAAYIKEWRLRFIFRKVLCLWRMNKMNKSCEKEMDPITLSEPDKEVHIYDWSLKRKFIFDAKSLATLIESKLMYNEYGFPVPMYPRNPKNNVEFTYKQLISIYYQLKNHGELRWGFTTLREYNFNKNRWHMYHKSALTINSIKSSITLLDSSEGRELFTDFIFAKMEELGLKYSNYIFNAYQIAMVRAPTHWYLEKLKSLAISHYEAEHFGHNRTRIINAVCLKIFKKNSFFINDLKAKNII